MSRGQVLSTSAGVTPSVTSGGKLATRPLPPPPVPPRPSKALVAEALARTRCGDVNKGTRSHAVPTRKAPPPPPTTPPIPKERNQEWSKSQTVNTAPLPKERTQHPQNILQPQTALKHGEPVKNVSDTGDNYFHSGESTTVNHGIRVMQSSRNDEGHSKGDFANRVNVNFSSDESNLRGLEEFRNVLHNGVSGISTRKGCNGQFLESAHTAVTGDKSTVLEIKNEALVSDLGLQGRRGVALLDAQDKTEIPAASQRLKPEQRLLKMKPKEQEEDSPVVSHIITTKPQEHETVSFPQRNVEKITEKPESNDHRQQTRTVQEVQSQHTVVFSGSDGYVRTASPPAQEETLRVNMSTIIMKQTRAVEDKQQKVRRHAPHMLPTGQHKHDSSFISSRSRNTVLLIDNSSSKRENLATVSQQPLTDNKDRIVNGIVASSCSPLVENPVVELGESSQRRTQLQKYSENIGAEEIQIVRENGVNGSGSKENERNESLYKPRIQHSDWFEVDNGKPVRYSSCHITIDDSYTVSSDSSHTESSSSTIDLSRSNSFQYTDYSELNADVNVDYRAQLISQHSFAAFNTRRNMASLQGLPPLPKSLSGINLFESGGGNLHFTPMDQQQQKPEVPTPRGMAKSGSFRQLASQSSSGSGGGACNVSSNTGAVRVMPSSSSGGRGPTPPTPGGTSHQQILHHQHVRSLQPNGDAPPPPIAPRVRKPTGLDAQLAVLRKEMVSSLLHIPGISLLALRQY